MRHLARSWLIAAATVPVVGLCGFEVDVDIATLRGKVAHLTGRLAC